MLAACVRSSPPRMLNLDEMPHLSVILSSVGHNEYERWAESLSQSIPRNLTTVLNPSRKYFPV
ncbi:MAG: hypothetical protein QOH63_2634 [Acidobacteriota bacterium]|jgi:hypothetical protein|nr:hypothetical protein [Acidobacteriota bacterium]